jgi:hypothetical protein
MRGQRTLFDDLLLKAEAMKTEKQRPRNALMPKRNTLLLYRYYYYVEIARLRFDDALKQLEREFFIVEARIVVLLTENNTQLRTIVADKPDRTTLKKLYPFVNWEYSPR